MCDYANSPGGREAAMVTIIEGTPERHGRDGVWCDPCIAPLVSAMNNGGMRTVASCCGHDRCPSTVILDDDRFVVLMTRDQYEQIAGIWPGINDESPTTRVVSI